IVTFGPTVFDRYILTCHIAGLGQTLAECRGNPGRFIGESAAEKSDHRHGRLLCARGKRPHDHRATCKPQKITPFHCKSPPMRRARAKLAVDTALILRVSQRKHLEGWPQRTDSRSDAT